MEVINRISTAVLVFMKELSQPITASAQLSMAVRVVLVFRGSKIWSVPVVRQLATFAAVD